MNEERKMRYTEQNLVLAENGQLKALPETPALVAIALLVAINCGGGDSGEPWPPDGGGDGGGECEVEGRTYANGTTGIPSADNCNLCACEQGELVCTAMGCDPGSPDADVGAADGADGGGEPASHCSLPVDPGPCEAAIPRYYFDPDAGVCRQFTYGGCEGNQNNFEGLGACRESCLPGVFLRDLDLVHQTEGGVTGGGIGDLSLADDAIVFKPPVPRPEVAPCRTEWTIAQKDRLLLAAEAVDWGAVESTYTPYSNPSCQGDLYYNRLEVELVFSAGDPVRIETQWCTEDKLPADLQSFLEALKEIREQVLDACPGS